MILVTFAVPFESAAFRRRAASRSVRIVHTGVGADAARVALERALCELRPERVISSGFTGALSPKFRVGELVSDTGADGWRQANFATASKVLADADAKREFRQQTGADVVDMETISIRKVCAAAQVPLMLLRAISDGAEDDLGLPPKLLRALADRSLPSFPQLAWTLVSSGTRRRAFLRLIRNCRTAQYALANALEREILKARS